ncbi:MAG: hypothetical protein ACJA0C_001167 [Candidatus Endobugula sp.]
MEVLSGLKRFVLSLGAGLAADCGQDLDLTVRLVCLVYLLDLGVGNLVHLHELPLEKQL